MYAVYKMIIVDDESGMRELLENYINSRNIGFQVVKSFSSAISALEFIAQNDVQLVITDIKMPQMSGIELIKILTEKYPLMKKVIISGYEEFEYAKAAIQYKVHDYLMKPLEFKKIDEILLKIKKETDEQIEKESILKECLTFERESFFLDLIMGASIDKKNIYNSFLKLGFNIPEEELRGQIFEIEYEYPDGIKYTDEEVDSIIEAIIGRIYVNNNIVQITKRKDSMFFASVYNKKNGQELNCELIENEVNSMTQIKIKTKIICDFEDLSELIGIADDEFFGDERFLLLTTHIKMGDEIKAKNLLESIINNIINSNTIMKRKMLMDNLVNEILNDAVLQNSALGNNDNETVGNAIQFINEHYSADITREDIAQKVYMSKSHLDKIFKIKTGKTMKDYLVEVRMKKAFEFLKNGMPVSQIYVKVGYKDKRHFLRMFKEYTGKTPSEVKELMHE